MKVLITRNLPGEVIRRLQQKHDIHMHADGDELISRKELLERAKGVDAILSTLSEKMDAELMDAAGPKLKVIANYAVGFDNINLPEATKRGIFVANTPEVVTNATAELAIALMLAVARRIVEADRFSRDGKFKGWGFHLMGYEMRGKTLGIIGFGRIGRRVSEIAEKGFGMKVIYNDPIRQDVPEEFVQLDDLLARSDFISIHVPLTPETKRLLSEKEFAKMKRTAILVNTARGPIIDEDALCKALSENVIAGAGIDVYEREPHIHDGLTRQHNAVLSPHLGTSTIETRTAMADLAASAIEHVLEGRAPPNLLNKELAETQKKA